MHRGRREGNPWSCREHVAWLRHDTANYSPAMGGWVPDRLTWCDMVAPVTGDTLLSVSPVLAAGRALAAWDATQQIQSHFAANAEPTRRRTPAALLSLGPDRSNSLMEYFWRLPKERELEICKLVPL